MGRPRFFFVATLGLAVFAMLFSFKILIWFIDDRHHVISEYTQPLIDVYGNIEKKKPTTREFNFRGCGLCIEDRGIALSNFKYAEISK